MTDITRFILFPVLLLASLGVVITAVASISTDRAQAVVAGLAGLAGVVLSVTIALFIAGVL